MLFGDKRQIRIFVLANIAALCANGQNYAERGNLHTGIDVQDDDEEDLWHTGNYDWSEGHDDTKVWRWNVEEYPHPKEYPRYCNRMSAGNVCDPDGILIPDEVKKLDTIIIKLYNETSCICDSCGPNDGGIQVGIALLKNTFQPYIEHQSKVIRSFAQNLRSKWRLGECGNDILIVLATDDRQSYTAVGSTASKYISKDEAYKIFKKNKSYFSKGLYYEGLLEMLKAYENNTKAFAKGNNDDSETGMALISGIVVIIVIIVGILIVVAVILYRKRRDRKFLREPKCQRDDSRGKSSWHPKKIKTLFSTLPFFADPYEPCSTQEEKQKSPGNHTKIEESGRNDEEILNLELAEPDPKPTDTDVEVTTNDNHQTSESPVHYDSEGHDEIDVENRDQQVTDPSDPSNSSPDDQHEATVVEQHNLTENNPPTFITFTPKSQTKELHQTDL